MPRQRRTLAWKLSAIAIVQIALLAIVFMGVGWAVNGPPPELSSMRVDPNSVTIYDESGRVMGSSGNAPARPEDARDRFTPIVLDGHPARVVVRHGRPPRPGMISPLNTLFFGGLVILIIGSLFTARGIVRPLRQLARAAKALGDGDLRARSGLSRSDELGDLARAFDEMGDRVERLLLAEKELMANVSHELRTPLARIRVALDIAGEGDVETGRFSMSEIALDLAELETLIDDIMTTTRLEIARGPTGAAHFELHLEEIAVTALCNQSADRFRSRHPTRPLAIAVESGLPTIIVDPVLFRRVVDNVLENAHKYSPDAQSTITLRVRRDERGAVAFEIEDEGMGISKDDLPHLFTPFFRADRSRTRGTGGVGLGLTLAKRIVEAHRGTIGVTSTLGAGTTVRVVLANRTEETEEEEEPISSDT